jgi:hypothetical protein
MVGVEHKEEYMAEIDPRGGQPEDADEHALPSELPEPTEQDASPDYLINPFGDDMDEGAVHPPAREYSDVPEEERL